MKWYAIYKGDEFLYHGTREECAKYLGVEENTVSFYTTPTYLSRFKDEYANRIIVVKVDDKELFQDRG